MKYLQYTIYTFSASVLSLLFWKPAFAADTDALTPTPPSTPSSFSQVVCILIKLCLDFIPFIVVIAVGAFIQGLVKYIGNGDNEEKRSEGRKMMIYGTLGFFFMVGIWGILKIFVASFGNLPLLIPQFKSGGSSFVCR